MEYTQVPANTFETLQMNAGVVLSDFTPSTGAITRTNILGATTGGLSFASNPEFSDFGEDIDNVPNNTMQLKRITSYDPVISGTFLTISADLAAKLVGAADVGSTDTSLVTPRMDLKESDFDDIWFVGDYSDKNENGTGKTAGFVAIHIMNALNTAGFQLTTSKNEKGQFAFEFHGHYDIDDMDEVPFEIYVKAGTTST